MRSGPEMSSVPFHLNGIALQAREGESILQAAQRHSVDIPHLCHKDGLPSSGNCRACVVEIEGERALVASCCRSPASGMVVHSDNARASSSQRMVLELLLADLPERGHKWLGDDAALPHGELSDWAQRLGVTPRPALRALQREPVAPDLSHPAIDVNLDACIQCTRCLRACRDLQVNDVIGYARRGAESRVVFDLSDALGASTCVACGECVQACPTGALLPRGRPGAQSVDRVVDSVCPFCGVGCQLSYEVRTKKSSACKGVTARPITAACASRAALVLTMCTTRTV